MKKLKTKDQNEVYHANAISNKGGIAIFILDKVEFKPKQ